MGWERRHEGYEMNTCRAVGRDLAKLAALRPSHLPEWVRDHVADCRACGRQLVAARLAHGLVTAKAEPVLPPQGFADRVRTSLAARSTTPRAEPDVWRSAWGLLPTFAAAVTALVIVYQTSEIPGPASVFVTEGLTAGEQLLFDPSGPDVDEVLTAVLEGVEE
jgi:hypothetical protein